MNKYEIKEYCDNNKKVIFDEDLDEMGVLTLSINDIEIDEMIGYIVRNKDDNFRWSFSNNLSETFMSEQDAFNDLSKFLEDNGWYDVNGQYVDIDNADLKKEYLSKVL